VPTCVQVKIVAHKNQGEQIENGEQQWKK